MFQNVKANLGQGTFVYEGVRGVDCDRVTFGESRATAECSWRPKCAW